MLGALFIILGGSAAYLGILNCTSPHHVSIEENEKRIKITSKNKKRKIELNKKDNNNNQ